MIKWAIRQALSNNINTRLSVSDIKSEAEYAFMEIKEENNKSVCISNSSMDENKIEAHVLKDIIWNLRRWKERPERVFGVRGVRDDIADRIKSNEMVLMFIKDVTSELPEVITFDEFVKNYNSDLWNVAKYSFRYVYPEDYKILENIIKNSFSQKGRR